RVSIPLMLMFGHGLGKITGFSQILPMFNPPIPFLGAKFSLVFAIFAEFFCSFLVAIGLYTRFAAIPPAIVLLTAAGIVHRLDPWGKKEFALLYAIPFLVIMLTGPGG